MAATLTYDDLVRQATAANTTDKCLSPETARAIADHWSRWGDEIAYYADTGQTRDTQQLVAELHEIIHTLIVVVENLDLGDTTNSLADEDIAVLSALCTYISRHH
jgi:hypothetical protein